MLSGISSSSTPSQTLVTFTVVLTKVLVTVVSTLAIVFSVAALYLPPEILDTDNLPVVASLTTVTVISATGFDAYVKSYLFNGHTERLGLDNRIYGVKICVSFDSIVSLPSR